MCQDRNTIPCLLKKGKFTYLDRCIADRVATSHYHTLASCCGHGKYPKTLVIKKGKKVIEIYSNKIIPRKRRFYVKDKQGYYYIPETLPSIPPITKVKGILEVFL